MKHDGISTLKILFIFSFPTCQFLLIIFVVSRFRTLTFFGNHNYYWSCWNLITYRSNSVLTAASFVSWILYFDLSLYWLNVMYKYFLPECLIAPVFSEFMTPWECALPSHFYKWRLGYMQWTNHGTKCFMCIFSYNLIKSQWLSICSERTL